MQYPPLSIDYSRIRVDKKAFFIPQGSGTVEVRFFGTNSLIFKSDTTNLFIDPYFSRSRFNVIDIREPGSTENHLKPHIERINGCLDSLAIGIPDAMAFTHSHFDHVLDLPYIMKYYFNKCNKWPLVLGCPSVANVALGGVAEKDEISSLNNTHGDEHTVLFKKLCSKYNISIVQEKSLLTIGTFSLTFLHAKHIPTPPVTHLIDKTINKPLNMPKNMYDYQLGAMHKILIDHPRAGRTLVLGSGGFEENEFYEFVKTYGTPDTLFQAIAAVNRPSERNNLYKKIIVPLNPGKIFLSHWDDFDRGLDEPVHWLPLTSSTSIYEKIGRNCKFLPLLDRFTLPDLN